MPIDQILTIRAEDIVPSVRSVLSGQGVPGWPEPESRIKNLAAEAVEVYRKFVQPAGIIKEVTKKEFEQIFTGEGNNHPDAPAGPIGRSSDGALLFAVTVGGKISQEIDESFSRNDFARGSMIDSAASEGAEMAAQAVENFYRRYLTEIAGTGGRKAALRFSPGYCGWHISGQKKLFGVLHPEEIGIRLNESYMMQPLKSVSGVVFYAPRECFYFDDTFAFCAGCAARNCRDRIKSIME